MEKIIPLTKGKNTIVDIEDFELYGNLSWCLSDSGNGICYAQRKEAGKTVFLHRLIMNVSDRKLHVDHKNHNTLDNRKHNLRVCSQADNNRNKSSHSNSTSKYLGVSFDSNRGKWRANIYVNKKLVFLGRFESEIDAAVAYDIKAKNEFGQFANLNFK